MSQLLLLLLGGLLRLLLHDVLDVLNIWHRLLHRYYDMCSYTTCECSGCRWGECWGFIRNILVPFHVTCFSLFDITTGWMGPNILFGNKFMPMEGV